MAQRNVATLKCWFISEAFVSRFFAAKHLFILIIPKCEQIWENMHCSHIQFFNFTDS